ncbi:hypothetical protein C4578_01920 [Candidatus Microgenomates bacterium]|jgi:hypothetical protein|nr:MAG: hypothetical protein C4578_01920 [Candidatus Microgenomates bacterium]
MPDDLSKGDSVATTLGMPQSNPELPKEEKKETSVPAEVPFWDSEGPKKTLPPLPDAAKEEPVILKPEVKEGQNPAPPPPKSEDVAVPLPDAGPESSSPPLPPSSGKVDPPSGVVAAGPKSPSKAKTLIMVAVFFLVAAVSASGYYLFQKGGMGIQKKAYTLGGLACKRWSGGWPVGYKSPSSSTAGKINFFMAGGGDGGEEVVAVCDYQKALEKAGGDVSKIKCDQGDSGVIHTDYRANMTAGSSPSSAGYTRGLSDFIQWDHYGGKCQVIQVDLTGCNKSGTYDGQSYPSWDGGVAFVIAYNDECPVEQCMIQGYKVMMPGNKQKVSPAFDQKITCVKTGGTLAHSTTLDPYRFTEIPAGEYTCSATVPSGYTVGSTYCENRIDCHNDTPVSDSSRKINCPAGGYADLWWHYYAMPTKPPPTPTTAPTDVPGPTDTPTTAPTLVPAACSSLIVDNVTTGETNVSSVEITDTIKFTINFTTTTNVDAVAIRIIENGQVVATMIDERANNNTGQIVGTWETNKWYYQTNLPTNAIGSGQAQLEFKAYIKTNGAWR